MACLSLPEIQTPSPISPNQHFYLLCNMLLNRTALRETMIINCFSGHTKSITCSPREELNYKGEPEITEQFV